jgi:hypothetical protein
VIINKKIALTLVVTNLIFLTCGIFLFFYFHHTIIQDFTHPEPIAQLSDSVWSTFLAFLNMAVYIGLFWVLGAFREHILIRVAMLVLLLLKIPAIISLNWNHLESLAISALFQSLMVFFACLAVAMILMLLFVRNKIIKGYFRCFVGVMLLALVLPQIGAYAYDNLDIHWLLIDRFLLVWLSFIPTLLLFIKVYRLSRQSDFPMEE